MPSRRQPLFAPFAPLLLTISFAVGPGAPSAATVYRCEGAGATEFSQFPCGAAATGSRQVLPPAQVVRVPPLQAAERRRLEALAEDVRRERARRAAARARAARQARQQAAEQAMRCREVKQAEAALARERRKGYTLAEARALARREAEIEARRRVWCRTAGRR